MINAEDRAQPDKPQLPTVGKGPDGPDTRTCSRLVQHLLDEGEVELTRLQYNQELVATTREVRMCSRGGGGDGGAACVGTQHVAAGAGCESCVGGSFFGGLGKSFVRSI